MTIQSVQTEDTRPVHVCDADEQVFRVMKRCLTYCFDLHLLFSAMADYIGHAVLDSPDSGFESSNLARNTSVSVATPNVGRCLELG